ncbi:hypothetical protein O4M70_000685 [Staphylococcus pseudintermedius]|uniref:hypothetical protein n=1 Tax=Staphylococcus pseudintermedius TaxID=283734 RepID=UPI00111FF4E3|nr:hypothetical protein [Staphylococcus pseudintermedius]EGQ0314924.1 hypothetical protein [Staphylococcus pseudintermedius]EGQ0370326.1 hypothetical protein [Staphylococcus pseudintermedius]EGQ0381035.1 hypothetical protein [Staphylococcus pseudintermedius]EGQ1288508.1 hypothetical protein [Staphylococcus pseudintermedius]EGQ1623480.1 hypothetical protein [Staphylococcus pseudintermedius]
MSETKDRSEYFREYRKRNLDRINKQQRERYLNKKLGIKKQKTVSHLLIQMSKEKQERINRMTPKRRERRRRLQEVIYQELKACT